MNNKVKVNKMKAAKVRKRVNRFDDYEKALLEER